MSHPRISIVDPRYLFQCEDAERQVRDSSSLAFAGPVLAILGALLVLAGLASKWSADDNDRPSIGVVFALGLGAVMCVGGLVMLYFAHTTRTKWTPRLGRLKRQTVEIDIVNGEMEVEVNKLQTLFEHLQSKDGDFTARLTRRLFYITALQALSLYYTVGDKECPEAKRLWSIYTTNANALRVLSGDRSVLQTD